MNGHRKIIAVVTAVIMLILPFTILTNAQKSNIDSDRLVREQNIRKYLEIMFSQPEYDQNDIENVCNYINGNEYAVNETVEDIYECGTYQQMVITAMQEQCASKNVAIPNCLETANQKISNQNITAQIQTNSATNNYIISDSGKFKVYHDGVDTVDTRKLLIIASIFDGISEYFCSIYNFKTPTTDGEYYEVYLDETPNLGYAGATFSYRSGRSYIRLSYNSFAGMFAFGSVADRAPIGIAAHEYMHAILHEYGINETNIYLNNAWFHEALARAAGIEYEEKYANMSNVCNDIRSFVSSLDTPILDHTGENEGNIRNGSALFFLALFDNCDEWNTIRHILERIQTPGDFLDAIGQALIHDEDSSLEEAFGYFMACNVSPDDMYSMSPKNKLNGTYNTWGTPPIYKTFTCNSPSGYPYASPTRVSAFAMSCTKYNFNGNYQTQLAVDITYSNNNGGLASIRYMYHNKQTGEYVISDELAKTSNVNIILNINSNVIDQLYVIVSNSSPSGNVSYSSRGSLS